MRRRKKTIRGGDFFCGAGGFTTGLMLAAVRRGFTIEDFIAVNCNPTAIATHSANHSAVRHFCRRLEGVSPRLAVPGGRLEVLIASPECTHHSRARGGKPMSDQSRAGGMLLLDWASQLYIDRILGENVPEWEDWGPLGADGLPLKSRKGESFRALVDGLRRLGYKVEWRVLNSADYGAATARSRLYLQAVRTGKIVWPKPTHDEFGRNGLKPWRCWTEIVDLSLRGKSIFNREKPLSQKTLDRIAAGLKESGLEPFLIHITHAGKRSPIARGRPLPTITTANRGELALIRPFLLGQQSGAAARFPGKPLPTISRDGAIALIRPFLIQYYGTSKSGVSAGRPLGVITTKARFGVVMPLVRIKGKSYQLDVEYRMLQPSELAAGMGFPRGYKFAGNKTQQIAQIGNAVEVNTAEALGGALLEGLAAA